MPDQLVYEEARRLIRRQVKLAERITPLTRQRAGEAREHIRGVFLMAALMIDDERVLEDLRTEACYADEEIALELRHAQAAREYTRQLRARVERDMDAWERGWHAREREVRRAHPSESESEIFDLLNRD